MVIPPAKLSYEVEDPNFETQEKKVATALSLYAQNLISARKVLETVDMEDQVEETELRLQEEEIKKQEMFNFQQNVFQDQVATNGMVQDKRSQLLDKMTSEVDKVSGGVKPAFGRPAPPKGQTPPQLQPYAQATKKRFGSVIEDVDEQLVNNIGDPEIKSLYRDYLKEKIKAIRSINESTKY